ncbi:alpha-E domain-containing protein [Flavicella sp.]|uniref:alpha-E domain-containing protein n=1 Tax=Flavicella sp. TaxID=2957742 RepID=UPI0026370053|nr:alpha-E domain-containing protein [Flavicella sp.]MDG1806231.1 alpha-E domain-containing protein [Flavicella sp.]
MLARVANNLFWMGRYLERTEHIARFINVNYFSSLDAPNEVSQSRQFVLKSILYMVNDTVIDSDDELNEQEVLFDVALNPENEFSILNCFKYARENASSARDLLSMELFRSINELYYYIKNYDVDLFVSKGLDEFTSKITKEVARLRGKIIETLIHDETYAIITLGINLEKATQVIRIINTKYIDAKSSQSEIYDSFNNSYEWTTLLKCIQSFDMMKRFYKKAPVITDTLEFLVLNPSCPRSILSSLDNTEKNIKILSRSKEKDSSLFLISKTRSEYKYMSIDEIEGSFSCFIEDTINKITAISISIEKEFLS